MVGPALLARLSVPGSVLCVEYVAVDVPVTVYPAVVPDGHMQQYGYPARYIHTFGTFTGFWPRKPLILASKTTDFGLENH